MKKYILIFFFLTTINTSISLSDTNIVFLDMDKIMLTSKAGSSILKQLDVLNKKALANFTSSEKKLKDAETKLIAQKNILAKTEYDKKVIALRSEIKIYQDERKKIILELNDLKLKSTNKLLQKVNQILIKFSEEKSISLILQKKDIVTGKVELDISDDIIKIVDLNIKEFKIKWQMNF